MVSLDPSSHWSCLGRRGHGSGERPDRGDVGPVAFKAGAEARVLRTNEGRPVTKAVKKPSRSESCVQFPGGCQAEIDVELVLA
jgi:hypothetical protein